MRNAFRRLRKLRSDHGSVLGVVLILVLQVTLPATAQRFSVLYSSAGPPDAAGPTAALVMDAAGNFYGTTFFGGSADCLCGAVFKLTRGGREVVLYSFTGGSDGANPYAAVIRDSSGNLYGTTTGGGDLSCQEPGGCGTVFKIDSSGVESVLHAFTTGTDGEFPYAGLLKDAHGNLYGTTVNGGHRSSNFGTVFRVDRSGNEEILYRFTGGKDGAFPFGTLVSNAAGSLLGTTSMFGVGSGGTFFRLTASSGKLTTLKSFGGVTGASP